MSNNKNTKQGNDGTDWIYSPIVKEHFFSPQNAQLDDPKEGDFDGEGVVGSPVCGDMMKMWIKVDPATERITACTWRTFGCASAIASTSMLSVMATRDGGMTLEDASKLKPKDILAELGGLPTKKIHCSVLGDQALRAAIEDYKSKIKKD